MITSKFLFLLGIYLCLIGLNCGPNSKEKSTDNSLSKLPMAFNFGMSKEDFFNHAESLNEKGILYQNKTSNALNLIQDIQNQQYEVNVLPIFERDKLVSVAFNYRTMLNADSDSPQSLNSLFEKIATFYMTIYGNKLVSVPDDEDGGIALVKTAGLYGLSIFRNKSDNTITVLFKLEQSN